MTFLVYTNPVPTCRASQPDPETPSVLKTYQTTENPVSRRPPSLAIVMAVLNANTPILTIPPSQRSSTPTPPILTPPSRPLLNANAPHTILTTLP